MKKFKKVLPVLLCLFMLVGCGTTATNDEVAVESEAPVETNDNELVLGFGYEPDGGFDPIRGSGHYGTSLFQSALFKRDVDLKVVEDLATDYELDEDRTTYTVTLRDGVKWSDGSDLSVDDVVFTYNTAKTEGTATVDLSNLESVEAVDDHTVAFHLATPDISFISKMVSLGIVPSKLYGEGYGENPVGTGPFEFVEWKKGEQLITKPNPYYYGEPVPFEKVTFLFLEPTQATVLAKMQGADVIRIPVTDVNVEFDGYHLETIKTMDNRGVTFPMPKRNGEVTGENTIVPGAVIGNDITSDLAVRKAFNIAIDRQAMIDGALNGQGTSAYSICDGTPWFNEEVMNFKDGDIEEANRILDEAGWVMGEDGVRSKDGLRAEMNLYYAYKDRENLALAFCETGKKIGFDLTPVYGEWSEIEPLMYSEMVLFGWGGYDPLELYYTYSSSMCGIDYYNPNYYSNKTVDAYLDAALQSATLEEAYDNFKKAQWDGETGCSNLGDAPWVWMVNENHCYLVKDNLEIGRQKVQPHGGGWPMLDTIANWKRK